MWYTTITSLQNEKIKNIVKLQKPKERKTQKRMLVEGKEECLLALNAKVLPLEIYFCPDLGASLEFIQEHFPHQSSCKYFEVNKQVFEKMSYREGPDGLIGCFEGISYDLNDFVLNDKEPPFFVIAESIEKPGNLGAILRSADASGVHGVIVCEALTDIWNPNVIRASKGTLFSVPIFQTSREECLAWLKKNKISLLAATPSAKHQYFEENMTRAVAIAVGTEKYGLSDKFMNEADIKVKIPMYGAIDSLNVSVAATLFMYEVVRQRKFD